MTALYETLERGGVGIFESPTGTGKTLSLLCGALTWLEDHIAAQVTARSAAPAAARDAAPPIAAPPAGRSDDDGDEPEWMRSFVVAPVASVEPVPEPRRGRGRGRGMVHRNVAAPAVLGGGPSRGTHNMSHPDNDDAWAGDAPPPAPGCDGAPSRDEYSDPDWASGGEEGGGGGGGKRRRVGGQCSDSSDDDDDGKDMCVEDELPRPKTQIIFCSRTHAQLSQVVGELRRTRFGTTVTAVPLAARRQLCGNPGVAGLGAAAAADKCRELQRDGTKSGGCPLLRGRRSAGTSLRDAALQSPVDVEDLVAAGRAHRACAYYAARRAAPAAQIILMPYPALMHPGTRASLGVNLTGAVIIIDEAHNAADAVASSARAEATTHHLAAAHADLASYVERYGPRLAPSNRRHLDALCRLAAGMLTALGGVAPPTVTSSPPETMLLTRSGAPALNIFRLARYLDESGVLLRVGGWAAQEARARSLAGGPHNGESPPTGGMAPLYALSAVITALTAVDGGTRVILRPGVSLAVVALDTAARFAPILAAARAVIFAGGTLGPAAAVIGTLCPTAPAARVTTFTCGHVIPPESLLAVAVGTGPTGAPLDFRHASRTSGPGGGAALLDELWRVVTNVSRVVPSGVVAFFPSFAYAATAIARAEATGALAAIRAIKAVFVEPRSAAEVPPLLREYGTAALAPHGRGALLLAVVGGRLSEGLNFSDGLGRCVVLIGLPYPPPDDPELAARMRHLDAGGGALTGRGHYDALCARAVGQSVGRAIRHIGDYAAVVLCDARWSHPGGPAAALPDWIRDRLTAMPPGGYGAAQGRLAAFFRMRQTPVV